MVNQRLIDYIQQSRTVGQADEQIRASLLANGWQETDINAGFQALGQQIPAHLNSPAVNNINPTTVKGKSSKKIIIIAAVALFCLILLGGGAFAYYKYAGNGSGQTAQTNEEVSQEQKSEEELVQSPDCGEDMDCFIEASKECKESKVVNTVTVDFGSAQQSTTSTYEIKGEEAGKCLFYLKTEKIDVELPPGTSPDVEKQQNDAYNQLEGREGTCKFQTADLTEMLTKWNQGEFSTGDFDKGDCDGTYFANSIG